MSKFAYEHIINTYLHNSYATTAEDSMKAAAAEAVPDKLHVFSDGNKPVTVSFDGTWSRRGYVSLNGIVTSICQGKCIDIEIMTKFCKACKFWNPKKGTPAYDDWKINQNCTINHTGSAGSMEVTGALRVYNRSVTKSNMKYLKYRGDGDSKAYASVVEADPYSMTILNE